MTITNYPSAAAVIPDDLSNNSDFDDADNATKLDRRREQSAATTEAVVIIADDSFSDSLLAGSHRKEGNATKREKSRRKKLPINNNNENHQIKLSSASSHDVARSNNRKIIMKQPNIDNVDSVGLLVTDEIITPNENQKTESKTIRTFVPSKSFMNQGTSENSTTTTEPLMRSRRSRSKSRGRSKSRERSKSRSKSNESRSKKKKNSNTTASRRGRRPCPKDDHHQDGKNKSATGTIRKVVVSSDDDAKNDAELSAAGKGGDDRGCVMTSSSASKSKQGSRRRPKNLQHNPSSSSGEFRSPPQLDNNNKFNYPHSGRRLLESNNNSRGERQPTNAEEASSIDSYYSTPVMLQFDPTAENLVRIVNPSEVQISTHSERDDGNSDLKNIFLMKADGAAAGAESNRSNSSDDGAPGTCSENEVSSHLSLGGKPRSLMSQDLECNNRSSSEEGTQHGNYHKLSLDGEFESSSHSLQNAEGSLKEQKETIADKCNNYNIKSLSAPLQLLTADRFMNRRLSSNEGEENNSACSKNNTWALSKPLQRTADELGDILHSTKSKFIQRVNKGSKVEVDNVNNDRLMIINRPASDATRLSAPLQGTADELGSSLHATKSKFIQRVHKSKVEVTDRLMNRPSSDTRRLLG